MCGDGGPNTGHLCVVSRNDFEDYYLTVEQIYNKNNKNTWNFVLLFKGDLLVCDKQVERMALLMRLRLPME